jgi:hypothetical protein
LFSVLAQIVKFIDVRLVNGSLLNFR